MFHLKILLLITIASKACLAQLTCTAQEDWDDYFKRGSCGDITEKCTARENWKIHFLKGDCDRFNEAIAKLRNWKDVREQLLTLIFLNYKGDLAMAHNIYQCITKMKEGTPYELAETQMKCFLLFNRALARKSQQKENVSVRVAIFMSQMSSRLKDDFKQPELDLLEGYVKQYTEQTLPILKSMCFDDWVQIKNADNNTELATTRLVHLQTLMWPAGSTIPKGTVLDFKWYVTRRFWTNLYGEPAIDVTLTSVEYSTLLASNQDGEVYPVAKEGVSRNTHIWTVEFWRYPNKDDGDVSFVNKETCKYLQTKNEFRSLTEKSIRVQEVMANRIDRSYFIMH